MTRTEQENSATYRIGAVARLTGVSVHTLRKWEDRYAAVTPHRSEGGERLYTPADLARLALIKRLADSGHSLRELASFSREELESRWEQAHATRQPGRRAAALTTAVLGATLPALLGRRNRVSRRLDIVATADDEATLRGALAGAAPDVLLVELSVVDGDTASHLRKLAVETRARATIAVYAFASRADLAALQAADITTLRAPLDVTHLEQTATLLCSEIGAPAPYLCVPDVADDGDAMPAPPRLSRQVIARVAATVPRIHCECPHHVADIILSLRAFEDYSAACESRNPADAELHAFLFRSAGRARELFEDAIYRLAEAEGFDLGE